MKYLREFATRADYDAFVESGTSDTPMVALINESGVVVYTPDDGFIRYHFDVELEEKDVNIFVGATFADFSGIYDRLRYFIRRYSEDNGYETPESIVLEKTEITINEDRVTRLWLNFEEKEFIGMTTDAPEADAGGHDARLEPDFIYYYRGK